MGEQFVLAIIRDISGPKNSESTIKKLTHALDQSPMLIMIIDKDGTIEYVNKTVTHQTGYTYEEIVGQNSRIFQLGKISPEIYKDLLNQLTNAKEWHGVIEIKNKNDEYFGVSATISPINDDTSKEFTHYLAIMEHRSKK